MDGGGGHADGGGDVKLTEQDLLTAQTPKATRPSPAAFGLYLQQYTPEGIQKHTPEEAKRVAALPFYPPPQLKCETPEVVDIKGRLIPTATFGTSKLPPIVVGDLHGVYKELLQDYSDHPIVDCVYQAYYIDKCLEGPLFSTQQIDKATQEAGHPQLNRALLQSSMVLQYANTTIFASKLPFTGCVIYRTQGIPNRVIIKLNEH